VESCGRLVVLLMESWTLYTTLTTVEGFVPTLCRGIRLLHPTAEDRTSRAWKCSTSLSRTRLVRAMLTRTTETWFFLRESRLSRSSQFYAVSQQKWAKIDLRNRRFVLHNLLLLLASDIHSTHQSALCAMTLVQCSCRSCHYSSEYA